MQLHRKLCQVSFYNITVSLAPLGARTWPRDPPAPTQLFLGLRGWGPHGTPLSVCMYVCSQEKPGSLLYWHICLMNHQKTHQTNPMAPKDPLDAPLGPLGPPGYPNRPPRTSQQVSWPHWTLQVTSSAFQVIRSWSGDFLGITLGTTWGLTGVDLINFLLGNHIENCRPFGNNLGKLSFTF